MAPSTATSEKSSSVDEKRTMDEESVDNANTTILMSKGKKIAIVSALCLAMFLAALDTVLITTALPSIAQVFHIPDAGYAWVGSAYLLTNAASVPSWGKVSDVFGRKPILMCANMIFLAGSLISALAKNFNMLLAGRAVQGLGGGGIVILVNICISDLFSLRERSLFYGLVGSVWAVASALGPVLGGVFAEKLTWRWCFWINLPFDGVAAAVLLIWLDIHNPKTPILEGLRSIDWLGSVTVAGATIMLLLGLQYGGVQYPWGSAIVVCLLVFSVLTFATFFFIQFKVSPSPIMPFRIFGHPHLLSTLAVCFLDAFVFNSVAYFMPLYFQVVLGASPLRSGVWMLALAVPLAIISATAGFLMHKTGHYLELLRGGLFLMTVGLGLCINFPSYISWPRIIVFLVVIGTGFGPNFHAPLIALQTRLQPKDIAAGTSTFGFIRMLAGACGVVLGQVIFQGQMQGHLGQLLAAGVPRSEAEQLAKGAAIIVGSSNATAGGSASWEPVVRQTKAESFSRMWILYTVASALALLVSFGIRRTKLSHEHTVVKTGFPNEGGRAEAGHDLLSRPGSRPSENGNEHV